MSTVVITGGSRGIGAAAVSLFAGLGHRVYFLYEKEHEAAAQVAQADEAAVATAVYLYLNGRHDEESGVLTIHVNDHSLWHEELNDRL